MPAVYRNPSSLAASGMADYLAVCGKGSMFEGQKGRKMPSALNGWSDTIMIVEVNPDRAVPWTKPEDWEPDPKAPLAGLGGRHPGFLVVHADGRVEFLPLGTDPKAFRRC